MQSKPLRQYKIHISLFFNTFLTFVSAHSMELFFMRKTGRKKEAAQAFIKEFPIMTFKNAYQRYKTCSLWERATIRNYFTLTHDDLLQKTFLVAVMLPPEVQNLVALNIFKQHKENAQRFISCPIKDSYLLYAWTGDVCQGKAIITPYFRIKSLNAVFQLSDEIKKAEAFINKSENNPSFCIGKKDIAVLQKISENSTSTNALLLNKFLRIRSHKKLTLKDFKDICFLPAIITGLLYISLSAILASRKIEQHFCKKIIIDTLLESKVQKLANLINKSGNLELLDALRKPEDYLAYPVLDSLKQNIPFFFLAAIPPGLDFLSPPDARSTLQVSAVSIAAAFVLWIFSHISFEKFPGGFLGIYIAIPYFIFTSISGYMYGSKTDWSTQSIGWSTIANKLANDSIVIPDESW